MTKKKFIVKLVKSTSVPDEQWTGIDEINNILLDGIAWNEQSKTFSANGSCGGKVIKESEIEVIVTRMMEELPYPIVIYRGRDDGIITFETEAKIEDLEGDHAAFEFQMDGLYIGWD